VGADWDHGSFGHALIVVAVDARRKTFLVSEMNLIAPWECACPALANADPDVLALLPAGLKMNSQASVRYPSSTTWPSPVTPFRWGLCACGSTVPEGSNSAQPRLVCHE